MQRSEDERQHRLGDAGARRQRCRELLQALFRAEAVDEGVENRLVHDFGPNRWLIGNWSARGDGLDQAGRTGRAQHIAVPTCKPDLAEMRRIQATSRGYSDRRSTISACRPGGHGSSFRCRSASSSVSTWSVGANDGWTSRGRAGTRSSRGRGRARRPMSADRLSPRHPGTGEPLAAAARPRARRSAGRACGRLRSPDTQQVSIRPVRPAARASATASFARSSPTPMRQPFDRSCRSSSSERSPGGSA